MAITVKGGFWPENGISTLTLIRGIGSMRRRAAQAIKHLPILQELMLELNGAAAGEAALVQRKRVQANSELGGKRVIETVDLLDRNTAAADETAIDEDVLEFASYDSTPVVNGDRNPLGTR